MQNNTVQTLIDYVKDISGQTNASTAKILRALNFGTDHLSYLKMMASGRADWDSRNHGDLNRTTTTTSNSKLLLENELTSVKKLELLGSNGEYRTLDPIDRRDDAYESMKNQSGTPTAYDIDGTVVRLLPTPDASHTYRITFSRIHPRFSADNLSQATGMNPLDEEYVALYAADKIMLGVSDSARVQVRNELTVKAEEIKHAANRKDQASPRRMKPTLTSAFSKRLTSRTQ